MANKKPNKGIQVNGCVEFFRLWLGEHPLHATRWFR